MSSSLNAELDRALGVAITAVTATPIAIPYRRPLALAAGVAREHCAVVVGLRDDGGRRGWGEIAPGPGTTRAEVAALAAALTRRGNRVVEFANDQDAESVFPCVRAGIQTALLDLEARRDGVPLHRLLHNGSVPTQISVNAMIDRSGDTRAIDEAVAAGFRCLKIKLDPERFNECEAMLQYVRRTHGADIRLRLDCNGQWPLAEARRLLRRLEPLALEYVEQPVADLEGLRALRGSSAVRIAADESASSFAQIAQAVECEAVDVLIVRPSRLAPLDCLRAAATARAAGIQCVVASNLESSLGIAAAVQVAAIIDAQSDRRIDHGLGTVSLLAGVLGERLIPRAGAIEVPTGAGCGITPAFLALFRIGPNNAGDAP